MTLKDAAGNTKVRELQSKQKGSNQRFSRFTRPAEVKGVSFLVKSGDEMYLYMPEFGKVRRIASHVKNENFMGSDFSYSDMGSGGYAKDYDVKSIKKKGKMIHLDLVPRKPGESEYGKLSMVIDTEYYLPVRIRFFDKKGTLWKEMTQERIEKVSSYWVARTITMRDLRKKHSTIMEMNDLAFDTGLKDSDFSKRELKRSR